MPYAKKTDNYLKMLTWTSHHARQVDEHPDFPVKAWQKDVAKGETRIGYFDWLKVQAVREDEKGWPKKLKRGR